DYDFRIFFQVAGQPFFKPSGKASYRQQRVSYLMGDFSGHFTEGCHPLGVSDLFTQFLQLRYVPDYMHCAHKLSSLIEDRGGGDQERAAELRVFKLLNKRLVRENGFMMRAFPPGFAGAVEYFIAFFAYDRLKGFADLGQYRLIRIFDGVITAAEIHEV